MRRSGPEPRTTKPAPGHNVFPYLLRGLAIERPNQVWCADITYIPIGRGFLYLVAIMDWASRAVLAWRPLGSRPPMAVWREGINGGSGTTDVDMTLRLDNAGALPTCPKPQQQQQRFAA